MSEFDMKSGSLQSERPSGQILVLFVLAVGAMIAMMGLVIEGGNLFAQQRIAQNGADASANAGTLAIAQKLAGRSRTGADILAAVSQSSSSNGIENVTAEYVDGFGKPFSPSVLVTNGAIPASARGVHVAGERISNTLFLELFGLSELPAGADATAITGVLSGGTGFVPVTFPTIISTCGGTNGKELYFPGSDAWPVVDVNNRTNANMSLIPLCTTDPGSVGWLDLSNQNLAGEIQNPLSEPIDIPTWLQTEPGNINSLETIINDQFKGKILQVPMFDGTCRSDPGDASSADTCPVPDRGTGDPAGNNTWYHIPYFSNFWLYEAYIGGNDADCRQAPGTPVLESGSGFIGCFKGWFVQYIYEGPIDPNRAITSTSALGIQLVK